MNFITISAVIILLIISILHFYWVFGGKVGLDRALPTQDGKRLLNPSSTLTFLVGVLLLGFAYVIFQLLEEKTNVIYFYLSWVICLIFLIRAIGDFKMVGFFKKIKGTDFANNDTRFFIPLCLYLSLSIASMVFKQS